MFPEWITFSAQNWITFTALQTPVSVNTLPRCPSFPGLLSEVKDGRGMRNRTEIVAQQLCLLGNRMGGTAEPKRHSDAHVPHAASHYIRDRSVTLRIPLWRAQCQRQPVSE